MVVVSGEKIGEVVAEGGMWVSWGKFLLSIIVVGFGADGLVLG